LAETGSTNADLIGLARGGARHGTVLVADHQTAGRGRLGRTWTAPPGSALLCSILLHARPGVAPHGAVCAVGLAARAAARTAVGVDVELKWPNDLMVGPRKVAGVLAESVTGPSGSPGAVVVGLGLNVGWPAPPPEVAARAVTLEELAGRPVDREALLRALLTELGPLVAAWRDAPDELWVRYRAELATLGQIVRVHLAAGDVVGEAVDVTSDGALVVATAAGPTVVSAGDVVHLRPA
jgi:BirA family biotin operon repressor/biotin-[acetyl-CoA-carboxylase] ligase